MSRLRALLMALLVALTAAAVWPAAAENVVRWARGDGVLTWDPHGAFTLPSYNGYRQVYEALVFHDPDFNLEPRLGHRLDAG